MKVYGQLEFAQFHNQSSNPTAGVKGKILFNTTDGKAYIDDGSSFQAFILNDQKAIFGTNGTANTNIRLNRAATGVLQFVLGGDTTAEGSLSTSLAQISAKMEGYATGSLPAAGREGRVLADTTTHHLKYDDGTNLIDLMPLTTKGDLHVYSTIPTRLAVGTNTYYLVADSTQATGMKWQAPTVTTKGDIYTFSTVEARLGVGSDTQYLVADSTQTTGMKWQSPIVTTKGDLYTYSTVQARLAVGTNTYFLVADSAQTTGLSWVAPIVTTKGDLYTYSTVQARLGIGADNTMLVADSAQATGMKWITPASQGIAPLTTKGDLYTFSTVNARLAVGTNTYYLVADSTQTTGMKWQAPIVTTKGDIHTYSTVEARIAVGTDGKVLTADSSTATGLAWNTPTAAPTQSYEIDNLTLVATVGSSALTIGFKDSSAADFSASSPLKIGFRNATAGTGTYTSVSATAAITALVISSGSTLGQASAQAEYIYVYAINNAGAIEIAASTTRMWDEGSVVTTTVEGGAGAADSRTAIYSTTARVGVALRCVGRIKSTQATAGTWATTPSEISTQTSDKQIQDNAYLQYSGGSGYGATSTKVRIFTTPINDTLTSPIAYVSKVMTDGLKVTILIEGVYAIHYSDADSGAASVVGLSLNSNQLATTIHTITDTAVLGMVEPAADRPLMVSCTRRFYPGDVICPHTNNPGSPITNTRCRFLMTRIRD